MAALDSEPKLKTGNSKVCHFFLVASVIFRQKILLAERVIGGEVPPAPSPAGGRSPPPPRSMIRGKAGAPGDRIFYIRGFLVFESVLVAVQIQGDVQILDFFSLLKAKPTI